MWLAIERWQRRRRERKVAAKLLENFRSRQRNPYMVQDWKKYLLRDREYAYRWSIVLASNRMGSQLTRSVLVNTILAPNGKLHDRLCAAKEKLNGV